MGFDAVSRGTAGRRFDPPRHAPSDGRAWLLQSLQRSRLDALTPKPSAPYGTTVRLRRQTGFLRSSESALTCRRPPARHAS
jgi:hypothetical protein